MCGIAGILRFDRPEPSGGDLHALEQMARAQAHRGPDDAGSGAWGACAMASQRLSILDLSSQGRMPMCSEDGRLALIHNGEIYNYLELRHELQSLGHRFRSDGDTEVILRAYQQWGEACVERFVGMWAFALYDLEQRRLLLSRDRLGIKPLYLHRTSQRLVFASEIKAIVAYLRALSEPVLASHASIATYAATGLVDGLEETFFSGITRFPAATNLLVSFSGEERRRMYWSLPRAAEAQREQLGWVSQEARFDLVRASLGEAVRIHLRSDVPVGVCLSGGLDSSAIVGLASARVPRVDTFTVHFPDGPRYDERQHSRAIVSRFGARSHERRVEVGPRDLLPTLRRIVWHLDEPSLALGVYPQWNVMELAHQDVKVVLDGQGGDEVFGGYMNYLPQHLYGLLKPPPSLGAFATNVIGAGRLHGWSVARVVARSALAMRLRQAEAPSVARTPDAALLAPALRPLADVSSNEWRLWPEVFPGDWLTNVLYWELTKTRLPALLRYEDRLSMAFSIESRVPFLDHRLVELAFALRGTDKIRGGWTKYALRRAMERVLPAEVTWRRDKKGFPTPVGQWLRDHRGAEARSLLRDPSRRSAHVFPPATLEPHLAAHESGALDRSWQLWRVLSTELWLDAFDLRV